MAYSSLWAKGAAVSRFSFAGENDLKDAERADGNAGAATSSCFPWAVLRRKAGATLGCVKLSLWGVVAVMSVTKAWTLSNVVPCIPHHLFLLVVPLVLHLLVVRLSVGLVGSCLVVGLHCVVHVVVWILWEGMTTFVGSVCGGHLGDGPWNSCVGHGEGQGAEHVHGVVGETKPMSTSARSWVWRSLHGLLPVVDELASDHRGTSEETVVRRPLEGMMPVGGELASDPRGASDEVHVETREGRTSTNRYGTRLVELGQGCEVEVKIPSDPEREPRSPGPGISLRERWGWKPLLRTLTSGIWVLLGVLRCSGFEGLLEAAASWERRGTYRTAWAVCSRSGCQCSYSYGQGPAIGPHTGRGCFRYLTSVWRALAPLMSPWCADGDVPTAANLDLHGGLRSHVSWHCDDEPLFGSIGEQKLIVSLSLGDTATFKRKTKSCLHSEVRSCRLHHGDLLVMDGGCQDQYLHCTSPGLADRRFNITYRWIRHHTSSCPLAAGVLGSLPTCAQGSPVLGPVSGGFLVAELVFPGLRLASVCGLLFVLASLAFRKTGRRGLVPLFFAVLPLWE